MNAMAALVQGLDFLVSGIWPMVSMDTFQKVTGPKADLWLVKTVGLMLAVIGAVRLYAYSTLNLSPAIGLLAVGSALSLAIVEFVYVSKRVISAVYLGDAFVELVLAGWWLLIEIPDL